MQIISKIKNVLILVICLLIIAVFRSVIITKFLPFVLVFVFFILLAGIVLAKPPQTLVLPPAADNSPVISLGSAIDPATGKKVDGLAIIHRKSPAKPVGAKPGGYARVVRHLEQLRGSCPCHAVRRPGVLRSAPAVEPVVARG